MTNFQYYTKIIICFAVAMFSIWYLKGYKSLCNEFETLNDSILLESPKPISRWHFRTINEVLTAKVYAYSSEESQTDGNPNIMANGKEPNLFSVACPSRYSFGTKVEIDGIVHYCEDRMAPRYRQGNFFDVWMPEKKMAITWGVRTLEVKILN